MKNAVIAKRVFLYVFCLTMLSNANGQEVNLPQIVPAVQGVASMAQQINYPVNYSTGIPEISIPLYEIKLNGFTLPITLTYHSGGQVANVVADWIGSGWSINAEPMVGRSIKGLPDEYFLGGFLGGYLHTDFMQLHRITDWRDEVQLKKMIDLANGTGNADGEPDEFYYRLASKSGKFSYTTDAYTNGQFISPNSYSMVMYPYYPIKISHNHSSIENSFVINDDDGSFYYFGNSGKNDETAIIKGIKTLKEYYTEPAENGWKASRITTCNGDEITFDYAAQLTYLQKINGDGISIEDSIVVPSTSEVPEGLPPGGFIYPPTIMEIYNNNTFLYSTDTRNPQTVRFPSINPFSQLDVKTIPLKTSRLKTITFPNGKVAFETIDDRLSSIVIWDNEKAIKTIHFGYNKQSFDTYRFDTLNISNGNSQKQQYLLQYDGQPYLKSTLPDAWGFASGIPYEDPNLSINSVYSWTTPTHAKIRNIQVKTFHQYCALVSNTQPRCEDKPFFFYIGSITAPNAHYENSSTGLLKSITYPTGGFTQFKFEANKYLSNGESKIGGGFRIVEIASYPSSGERPVVKTYKYGKNEDGNGFVKIDITPEAFMKEYTKLYGTGDCTTKTRYRYYGSSTILDPLFSNGAPVLYSQVTEYTDDGSNSSGKIIYNYDVGEFIKRERIPHTSIYYPNVRSDWQNGTLDSVRYYDSKNQLVKKGQYRYNYVTTGFVFVDKMYIVKQGIPYEPGTLGALPVPWLFGALWYNYEKGFTRLQRELTTSYTNAGNINEEISYEYNNLNQKISESHVSSSNDIRKTVYTYPQDYPGVYPLTINCENGTCLYASKVIETQKYKNSSFVESVKTSYGSFTKPAEIAVKTGSNPYETRVRFTNYMPGGPSEVIKDGIYTVYLYGYNGQYPIVKIENATYSDVCKIIGDGIEPVGVGKLRSIASSDKPENNIYFGLISNLRTQLPNALVTTYTYKPLIGISSMTDPHGVVTKYDYDSLGRLSKVTQADKVIQTYDYHYKN